MFKLAILILSLTVFNGCPVEARIRQTPDAIIIEADLEPIRQERASSSSGKKVPAGTYILTESRGCWTTDGHPGVCSSLRSCYPDIQLPALSDLKALDYVATITRGTCSYAGPDGRQSYGVCCQRQYPGNFGMYQPMFPFFQPAGFPWWQQPYPSPVAPAAPIAPVAAFPPVAPSPSPVAPVIPAAPSAPVAIEPQAPQSPSVEVGSHKSSCGVGPYKTLSLDEQSRIVGGQDALKNSWPFIISMMTSGRHFCGGSLINEQWVLTAAHCIASFTSADVAKLEVVLALHSIKPVDSSAIRKRVKRLIRHKGFSGQTLYNDIAIMKLDSPVTFSSTISPVCLPPPGSTHLTQTGKEATVIGWGSTKFQGPLPRVLQQVTIQVESNAQCKKNYGSYAPGEILDSMMCAGLPGRDSCQGDSGGPMIMQDSPGGKWVQYGVVSWGIECSKPPFSGVYTRVTHFIDWIQKNAQ